MFLLKAWRATAFGAYGYLNFTKSSFLGIMPRELQIAACKSLPKHPFKVKSPCTLSPLGATTGPDCSVVDALSRPVRTSVPHLLRHPFDGSNLEGLLTGLSGSGNRRGLSIESGNELATEVDQDKVVDLINIKFAEAREEIEMAMESKETVYFDEEAECARAVVKEVLDLFDGLLAKLPESERAALQRSMGLKIEQLKAELKQLDD
ncbi:uncharacterized protein LOC116204765 [Punica granatum]|uniref:Uncharacterized protein LOC116204765 n=2 Tax=Punica granatum TaxID=22663 RepID=A0A6P8DHV0_PUNGR|nr:uncharacterized protein LOC116204765 [Punica granatum]XP_031392902.1 uncharacterized protein LOC116204765 [Punica granatum]XP_031392903.1 uncharacterized protein LOC116204765 [Punica granatum]